MNQVRAVAAMPEDVEHGRHDRCQLEMPGLLGLPGEGPCRCL
jgi:hypothetical protein